MLGLLRRSRSSKVTEVGTNRNLICDFLLVINININQSLTSYLAPFPSYTTFDRSKIAKFGYTLLCLTPPTEGFHWDDLRKMLPGYQWMTEVPNGVEKLPKISIVRVGRTNVTDDRRQFFRISTVRYAESL